MDINQNYSLLIQKLDQFILKILSNQLIRGSTFYTVGAVLFLFLVFCFLEYSFYFGTLGRKILFSALSLPLLPLPILGALTLFHYFRLGETISHEEAARIIGDHFGDVKDKLLNVLNLKNKLIPQTIKSCCLLGIEQKTEAIKLVPFKAAIDLSKNKKYFR